MSFSVVDVRGDGSCFYRCLWRLAVADASVAADLLLEPDDLSDEELGVREIRDSVASFLDSWGEDRVRALLDLHRADATLVECYPVLDHVRPDADTGVDAACAAISRAVRDTACYASELELSIVRDALDDVELVVLSCARFDDVAALADRWTRDLHKALPLVDSSRLAVLVNENNVHWRLGRFGGRVVIDTDELRSHVAERMAESTDDD